MFFDYNDTGYTADQLAGAVAKDRERCAKVCENIERKGAWITKEEAAKAIRNMENISNENK